MSAYSQSDPLRQITTPFGTPGDELPHLRLAGGLSLETIATTLHDALHGDVLGSYLLRARWFQGKARNIAGVSLVDTFRLQSNGNGYPVYFLNVHYEQGAPEIYQIPVAFVAGPAADRMIHDCLQGVIAVVTSEDREGILCDAIYDQQFREAYLTFLAEGGQLTGDSGGVLSAHCSETSGIGLNPLDSYVYSSEQTNSTIIYGSRHVLKLYRKVEPGSNPEVELLQHLTETACFPNVPPMQGVVSMRKDGVSYPLALLLGYRQNRGDTWQLSQWLLLRYFQRIQRLSELSPGTAFPEATVDDVSTGFRTLFGDRFLNLAGLLGTRTAELHLALAVDNGDPRWRREEFTLPYQRWLRSTLCSAARSSLDLLARHYDRLSQEDRPAADRVLAAGQDILARLGRISELPIESFIMRIHGDLHLGQVLFTGRDYVFIDFEGEPAREPEERRCKQSPLRDVAGMIRSFHYAVLTALDRYSGDRCGLQQWAKHCFQIVSRRFLKEYLERIAVSMPITTDRADLEILLRVFLLDKALYELAYELNNRPRWVGIPLQGIEMLIREEWRREVGVTA